MTCRVDSTLIAGACVVGDRGLGVLGASIRSGASTGYLYGRVTSADDAKEVRGLIVTPPSSGTFAANENGTFSLTGAPDGTYSLTYRLFVDGADMGLVTFNIVVGTGGTVAALTASVSGLAAVLYSALGAISASVGDQPVTPDPGPDAAVGWDLWEPFILPYADECPDSTMQFHIRNAAIEFCRFTRVWQEDLAMIEADGASTNFMMNGPVDSEVGVLLKVTLLRDGYEPKPIDVVTPDVGLQRMDEGDLRPCAFTDGAGALVVWPPQPSGCRIVPRAVLKPSVMANLLPQFLFEHHASDIAAGALGSILAMPRKPWSDLKTAAIHASQFALRKSTVMLVVRRGNARSTRTTATRWF